ncbi:hypothetical protein ABT083_35295, partial [Streptomyces goshikiensis]|uniref:hypothetical protein n=1 Tax=Streptomyces goshikiensis TaxID=1942 RepID=UPI00331D1E82
VQDVAGDQEARGEDGRDGPAPGGAAVAGAVEGSGPACGPGGAEDGIPPAAPPRASAEHAHTPLARAVVEPDGGGRALPARVPVRGPDQPAPGPVELSVMRV